MSYILVATERVCQSFPQTVANSLEIQLISLKLIIPWSWGETAFGQRLLLLKGERISFSFLDCLLEGSHSLVGVGRRDVVFIFECEFGAEAEGGGPVAERADFVVVVRRTQHLHLGCEAGGFGERVELLEAGGV